MASSDNCQLNFVSVSLRTLNLCLIYSEVNCCRRFRNFARFSGLHQQSTLGLNDYYVQK